MRQKLSARLLVRSKDGTPEQIAQSLGIEPDRCWRIGEPVGETTLKYKDSGIVVESGVDSVAGLEEHVAGLLTRLRPVRGQVASSALRKSIAVGGYFATASASLHLTAQQMRELSELQVELDFDGYVVGDEARE